MDKQTVTQKGVLCSVSSCSCISFTPCAGHILSPKKLVNPTRCVSFSQSDVTVVSGEQGLITLNYYDNSNPYQSWAGFPNTNIDMTIVNPVRCGQGFGLPNTISIPT